MAGVIVHEWIARTGGSENVLTAIAGRFPDADVLCLWNEDPDRFDESRVRESWLARTPLRGRKALSMPFMPLVWRNLTAHKEYDWLLSSSHAFAHQARFRDLPHLRKFVYVHTPARYIWAPQLDPRGSSAVVRGVAPFFRALDRTFAQDDSVLAANSDYVRGRIADSWSRDAVVIYPPVEVGLIQSVDDWTAALSAEEGAIIDSLPETFILGASRFVSYKRLDLVIAAGEASDVPVVLAGAGPEESRLRDLAQTARVPVVFIRSPSDALLYALYSRALVYIFPPVEDFGIMPVEAMAAGARVIVNTIGGAKESVADGITGFHLENFGGADAKAAIEKASSLDRVASRARARAFSTGAFELGLADWMRDVIGSGDSTEAETSAPMRAGRAGLHDAAVA